MSSAWGNHKPEDGNADVTTLAKLGTIVESTRVAVAHVLNVSGDAISNQILWRSTEAFDPNPYTALSQCHRKVMPSAHSPHARKLPKPDGAAGRASHTSYTPSSGQPDHVTRVVTSGQERKATVHPKVPTRPNQVYVTKFAATETSEQEKPEATPTFIRLPKRHVLPIGGGIPTPDISRHGTTGHLHAPASPKDAWHATFANGRLISIGGQNTGKHLSPTRFAQLKQPLLTRVPLQDRRMTSRASSMAPPTASVHPGDRPRAKLINPKAEANPDNHIKGIDKRRPTSCHATRSSRHSLAMPLLFQGAGHIPGS